MMVKCQANRVELNEWQRKREGGQERRRDSKGQTDEQAGRHTNRKIKIKSVSEKKKI